MSAYTAAMIVDDGIKGCTLLSREVQQYMVEGGEGNSCAEVLTRKCRAAAQEKIVSPPLIGAGVEARKGRNAGKDTVHFHVGTKLGVLVGVQWSVHREQGTWKLGPGWGTELPARLPKATAERLFRLSEYCL